MSEPCVSRSSPDDASSLHGACLAARDLSSSVGLSRATLFRLCAFSILVQLANVFAAGAVSFYTIGFMHGYAPWVFQEGVLLKVFWGAYGTTEFPTSFCVSDEGLDRIGECITCPVVAHLPHADCPDAKAIWEWTRGPLTAGLDDWLAEQFANWSQRPSPSTEVRHVRRLKVMAQWLIRWLNLNRRYPLPGDDFPEVQDVITLWLPTWLIAMQCTGCALYYFMGAALHFVVTLTMGGLFQLVVLQEEAQGRVMSWQKSFAKAEGARTLTATESVSSATEGKLRQFGNMLTEVLRDVKSLERRARLKEPVTQLERMNGRHRQLGIFVARPVPGHVKLPADMGLLHLEEEEMVAALVDVPSLQRLEHPQEVVTAKGRSHHARIRMPGPRRGFPKASNDSRAKEHYEEFGPPIARFVSRHWVAINGEVSNMLRLLVDVSSQLVIRCYGQRVMARLDIARTVADEFERCSSSQLLADACRIFVSLVSAFLATGEQKFLVGAMRFKLTAVVGPTFNQVNRSTKKRDALPEIRHDAKRLLRDPTEAAAMQHDWVHRTKPTETPEERLQTREDINPVIKAGKYPVPRSVEVAPAAVTLFSSMESRIRDHAMPDKSVNPNSVGVCIGFAGACNRLFMAARSALWRPEWLAVLQRAANRPFSTSSAELTALIEREPLMFMRLGEVPAATLDSMACDARTVYDTMYSVREAQSTAMLQAVNDAPSVSGAAIDLLESEGAELVPDDRVVEVLQTVGAIDGILDVFEAAAAHKAYTVRTPTGDQLYEFRQPREWGCERTGSCSGLAGQVFVNAQQCNLFGGLALRTADEARLTLIRADRYRRLLSGDTLPEHKLAVLEEVYQEGHRDDDVCPDEGQVAQVRQPTFKKTLGDDVLAHPASRNCPRCRVPFKHCLSESAAKTQTCCDDPVHAFPPGDVLELTAAERGGHLTDLTIGDMKNAVYLQKQLDVLLNPSTGSVTVALVPPTVSCLRPTVIPNKSIGYTEGLDRRPERLVGHLMASFMNEFAHRTIALQLAVTAVMQPEGTVGSITMDQQMYVTVRGGFPYLLNQDEHVELSGLKEETRLVRLDEVHAICERLYSFKRECAPGLLIAEMYLRGEDVIPLVVQETKDLEAWEQSHDVTKPGQVHMSSVSLFHDGLGRWLAARDETVSTLKDTLQLREPIGSQLGTETEATSYDPWELPAKSEAVVCRQLALPGPSTKRLFALTVPVSSMRGKVDLRGVSLHAEETTGPHPGGLPLLNALLRIRGSRARSKPLRLLVLSSAKLGLTNHEAAYVKLFGSAPEVVSLEKALCMSLNVEVRCVNGLRDLHTAVAKAKQERATYVVYYSNEVLAEAGEEADVPNSAQLVQESVTDLEARVTEAALIQLREEQLTALQAPWIPTTGKIPRFKSDCVLVRLGSGEELRIPVEDFEKLSDIRAYKEFSSIHAERRLLNLGKDLARACRQCRTGLLRSSFVSNFIVGSAQTDPGADDCHCRAPNITGLGKAQATALTGYVAERRLTTYVQGPPGTGKTFLIVRMLKEDQADDRSVVVAAPTRRAVANLYTAAVAAGLKHCAVVSSGAAEPPVEYDGLNVATWAQINRSGVRFVFGTVDALSRPEARKFGASSLIGEEMSQQSAVTFLNTLLIGSLAGFTLRQLVIFADNEQLQLVNLRNMQHHRMLNRSVSEALSCVTAPIRLDVNYRNPNIFGMLYLYGLYGKTQSVGPVSKGALNFHAPRGVPVRQHGSLYNEEEASAIIGRLNVLKETHPDMVQSCAVITPYDAQVQVLRQKLAEAGLDVTAATIDAFQGSERDLILVSLVKTDADSLGQFVVSSRRVNVAVTRHKTCLEIFGPVEGLFCTKAGKAFAQVAYYYGCAQLAPSKTWDLIDSLERLDDDALIRQFGAEGDLAWIKSMSDFLNQGGTPVVTQRRHLVMQEDQKYQMKVPLAGAIQEAFVSPSIVHRWRKECAEGSKQLSRELKPATSEEGALRRAFAAYSEEESWREVLSPTELPFTECVTNEAILSRTREAFWRTVLTDRRTLIASRKTYDACAIDRTTDYLPRMDQTQRFMCELLTLPEFYGAFLADPRVTVQCHPHADMLTKDLLGVLTTSLGMARVVNEDADVAVILARSTLSCTLQEHATMISRLIRKNGKAFIAFTEFGASLLEANGAPRPSVLASLLYSYKDHGVNIVVNDRRSCVVPEFVLVLGAPHICKGLQTARLDGENLAMFTERLTSVIARVATNARLNWRLLLDATDAHLPLEQFSRQLVLQVSDLPFPRQLHHVSMSELRSLNKQVTARARSGVPGVADGPFLPESYARQLMPVDDVSKATLLRRVLTSDEGVRVPHLVRVDRPDGPALYAPLGHMASHHAFEYKDYPEYWPVVTATIAKERGWVSLYHGTTAKSAEEISRIGLKPMARKAVHASIQSAIAKPHLPYRVVLDVQAIIADGHTIYDAAGMGKAFLVQPKESVIPPHCLKIVQAVQLLQDLTAAPVNSGTADVALTECLLTEDVAGICDVQSFLKALDGAAHDEVIKVSSLPDALSWSFWAKPKVCWRANDNTARYCIGDEGKVTYEGTPYMAMAPTRALDRSTQNSYQLKIVSQALKTPYEAHGLTEVMLNGSERERQAQASRGDDAIFFTGPGELNESELLIDGLVTAARRGAIQDVGVFPKIVHEAWRGLVTDVLPVELEAGTLYHVFSSSGKLRWSVRQCTACSGDEAPLPYPWTRGQAVSRNIMIGLGFVPTPSNIAVRSEHYVRSFAKQHFTGVKFNDLTVIDVGYGQGGLSTHLRGSREVIGIDVADVRHMHDETRLVQADVLDPGGQRLLKSVLEERPDKSFFVCNPPFREAVNFASVLASLGPTLLLVPADLASKIPHKRQWPQRGALSYCTRGAYTRSDKMPRTIPVVWIELVPSSGEPPACPNLTALAEYRRVLRSGRS